MQAPRCPTAAATCLFSFSCMAEAQQTSSLPHRAPREQPFPPLRPSWTWQGTLDRAHPLRKKTTRSATRSTPRYRTSAQSSGSCPLRGAPTFPTTIRPLRGFSNTPSAATRASRFSRPFLPSCLPFMARSRRFYTHKKSSTSTMTRSYEASTLRQACRLAAPFPTMLAALPRRLYRHLLQKIEPRMSRRRPAPHSSDLAVHPTVLRGTYLHIHDPAAPPNLRRTFVTLPDGARTVAIHRSAAGEDSKAGEVTSIAFRGDEVYSYRAWGAPETNGALHEVEVLYERDANTSCWTATTRKAAWILPSRQRVPAGTPFPLCHAECVSLDKDDLEVTLMDATSLPDADSAQLLAPRTDAQHAVDLLREENASLLRKLERSESLQTIYRFRLDHLTNKLQGSLGTCFNSVEALTSSVDFYVPYSRLQNMECNRIAQIDYLQRVIEELKKSLSVASSAIVSRSNTEVAASGGVACSSQPPTARPSSDVKSPLADTAENIVAASQKLSECSSPSKKRKEAGGKPKCLENPAYIEQLERENRCLKERVSELQHDATLLARQARPAATLNPTVQEEDSCSQQLLSCFAELHAATQNASEASVCAAFRDLSKRLKPLVVSFNAEMVRHLQRCGHSCAIQRG